MGGFVPTFRKPYFVWSSKAKNRPRALLLPLPFQFCFVAIIKEARALSNKIITVCSAADANGSAAFVPTGG